MKAKTLNNERTGWQSHPAVSKHCPLIALFTLLQDNLLLLFVNPSLRQIYPLLLCLSVCLSVIYSCGLWLQTIVNMKTYHSQNILLFANIVQVKCTCALTIVFWFLVVFSFLYRVHSFFSGLYKVWFKQVGLACNRYHDCCIQSISGGREWVRNE